MSNQTRAMLDSIWPEGAIWSPAPDDDLDKLLDGIANNWDYPRDFLAQLADIRNPHKTTFLSDLERDFGVLTNNSLTEAQKRAGLSPLVYNRDSNGSDDRLQMALDDAGFTVQVHSNSPAVDPSLFIDQDFQVVLGGGNAYLGRADAFMGVLGGEWLVNGDQFSIGQEYTSQMGQSYLGDVGLGEYTDVDRTKKIYTTPTDPDSWPFCFFVGGDATRNGSGELTEILQADIPSEQQAEFKRIILKYKPIFTWAGLIVNYT